MPSERPEDGWLMVTNKLAQRIRELTDRVSELESMAHVHGSMLDKSPLIGTVDTTHDSEDVQDS